MLDQVQRRTCLTGATGGAVGRPQTDGHQEGGDESKHLRTTQLHVSSAEKQEVAFFFSHSAPGLETDEVLPSCPGGGVATYRCHHQSRDSPALHSGDDGGDEDEDRPDGVVEELLEQQNSGHTTAHQPITVIYEDPADGARAESTAVVSPSAAS